MKEYFLIPASDAQSIFNARNTKNTPTAVQNHGIRITTNEKNLPHKTQAAQQMLKEVKLDNILENPANLPPEILLKLYDNIKRSKHSDDMENKIEDTHDPEKADIDMKKEKTITSGSAIQAAALVKRRAVSNTSQVDSLIKTLPISVRLMAKGLYNELISSGLLSLNSHGLISTPGVAKIVRLEDFLRSILVKNARIEHVKPIILALLPKIPSEYIRNSKVSILNSSGSGKAVVVKDCHSNKKVKTQWIHWCK